MAANSLAKGSSSGVPPPADPLLSTLDVSISTVNNYMPTDLDPAVEKKIIEITGYCVHQLASGVEHDAVVKHLIESGVDTKLANKIVEQAGLILIQRLVNYNSSLSPTSNNDKMPADSSISKVEGLSFQILIGIISFIIGVFIILVNSSSPNSNNKYLIWYGAILFGLWNIISGFAKRKSDK